MKTATDIDILKDAHRATWNSGDYATVADRYVVPLGKAALEHAGRIEGLDVLDIATGSGLVAIPAAEAGARVTGLDLASELLDVAAERSAEAGVDVDWVEGDAEALPFEDESFDVVLSTVGVQFAPRHEVVAAEIARVLRPGGRVVLCSWTPRGLHRAVPEDRRTADAEAPAAASPPPLWGDDEHVSDLFAQHGVRSSSTPARPRSLRVGGRVRRVHVRGLRAAAEGARASDAGGDLGGAALRPDRPLGPVQPGDGGFDAPSEFLIASGVKEGS